MKEYKSEAYEYWKNNFNPNLNDCCNLRNSHIKGVDAID